jgi:hypothetical protein
VRAADYLREPETGYTVLPATVQGILRCELPTAHRPRRPASIPAIVIYRQEVRPMYAVSAVGAPLQSTIA